MSRLYLGLSSTEGDRLGHLVRGVQMLRSYGQEAEIASYSDVVDVPLQAGAPPAYACVVGGESRATLDALQGICRETEWALGEQPATLSVWLLQLGDQIPGNHPGALDAIRAGRLDRAMTVVMPGGEFARLCDWGQQLLDGEGGVIGEWPSATGP